MKELTRSLEELNRRAEKGGRDVRIEKQHSVDKLTTRERIGLLLEKKSFIELDKPVTHQCTDFGMGKQKFSDDGVVAGCGMIGKRLVYVFAQDLTVFGGALSETHAGKICEVMDMAMQMGAPIIGLNDSGGVRIQEDIHSLAGYAEIFLRNSMASGVIPQISTIMGPCTSGTVYSPALTDFILVIKNSGYMFITGPGVVKSVTQGEVSKEDLGGVGIHMTKFGMAHLSAENDIEYINYTRKLISYLPGGSMEEPPFVVTNDSPTRLAPKLSDLVPTNPSQPYNIKEMTETVADDNSFSRFQAEFAANIATEYIRLNGRTIGVVANQPLMLAGILDVDAPIKVARFVRFCDAFNTPLLTPVDVPGFFPEVDQEYGGIIRNGAKLLHTHCGATVPKVAVITRKAYGGIYDVMSSKHIHSDVNLAFPTVGITVMGSDGAVNILFKKKIEKSQTPEERQRELQSDYREKFASPYRAAELDYVDEAVDSAVTYLHLIHNFEMLVNKRQSNPPKKHSNIPL